MKKCLIILLILFVKLVTAQQEWAPIGAEWYYSKLEGQITPSLS